MGCAEYILEEDEQHQFLTPDAQECLLFISQESGQLLKYMEKLLNLAYLEAGKIQLNRKKVAIIDLVRQSMNIHSSKFMQKQLDVSVQIDRTLTIHVDKTLFIHVINNLLGNAIKFTPSQGSIILRAAQDNDTILLAVIDTGVGIETKNEKFIFDEFEKVSSVGTEGETGSGLGLSICKKIVEAHDFSISFTSSLGQGTEFTITIPSSSFIIE